jgi:hypothetical protein
MNRRTEFTIKFAADLDGVPGWGNIPNDWIELATENFKRQSHYNTSCELVSVEIIPPRQKP